MTKKIVDINKKIIRGNDNIRVFWGEKVLWEDNFISKPVRCGLWLRSPPVIS